ncbi:BTAD domain-containing putative transcriptional regulator [Phytohabitans sp. ZYX-F-186]|uniref:BTAD domain-containing putative transcriptional regulator n=1 Tax=Phytohabitans maris TaxID=3071409 RepID=A0ABU0ZCR6_9ACTN|nr:BTAD domain-containing putative transcriptional regulator [Phytohabitans sp. ZYX-F-186]MDQ7904224.1 BTAD domain-containing putative transcriptional regulator [Phytohabitans sp. ZYX-F-186]
MAPQNAEATVGSLLRRYRLAAGLSQQELAAGAAVSVRTIRDIEHERVDAPRAPSLRRLAEALGLAAFDRDRLLAALPGPRPEPDAGRPLRVEVLGPLSVRTGPAAVDLGPAPQRDLLALLALQPGRVVSRDEIVDVLWGDQPPKTCLSMVQTYVGRLRGRLDPDREPRSPGKVIRLAGDGYAIDLDTDELDLAQFQELVERGTAEPDPAAAVDLLDRALRCWRGPVLAGASPRLRSHPAAVAAARRRVRAALAYADLAADLGLHEAAVARLQELAPDEPLHEGVAAKLMVALSGSGERAAALSLFAEVSRRLADELGVEPSAELRDTHLRILRQEQVVRRADPRPRQLPAAVPGFTGRATQLERLDALLPSARTGPGTAVVISAIDGTAGVGKTALAVHWAHRVADRFPDGQLYVNLRGFDPAGPVPPDEAVRGFLDALHVPAQRMPVGLDAQAALYRSLLAGRRMLVVLDNARDADQVRPLLPGSPGCLVIVTSRDQLAGLVAAEGAHPVPLDLLDPDEAVRLLARRLGADRVAAEPEALAELVRACAGLPLALVIVAARAATRPGLSLAALAAELGQARGGLDAFSGADPATDVRAVFSWSYRSLSEPAARLFRLLGLHPGPDLATAAAASLAGVPPAQVRPLLAELARARLLAEQAPERYAFHDLLRAYAAELAARANPPQERQAALHRLLDHYLHTAYAADERLNPHRDQITRTPAQPGVTVDGVGDQRQALAWFAAEHATLLAVVEHTATAGCDSHTWQLAWALTTYLDRQGHWHDWAGVQDLALTAARRLGHRPDEADAHRGLARAYARVGRFVDAHVNYWRALDVFGEIGDWLGEANTHRNLAFMCGSQGHQRDALYHASKALDLYRAGGHRVGEANALNNVGWYHAQNGEYREALEHCEQALALLREIDHRPGVAATLDSIGYAHHHLGNQREAVASFGRALEMFRVAGDRSHEAGTLTRLGDAHHAAGDRERARRAWRQALVLLEELDQPEADEVRGKLAGLPPPA